MQKPVYKKQILSLSFSVITLVIVFFSSAVFAYERIVVLYAAASPILKELGVGDRVVGVTRTDGVFSSAIKVGSHLRPNIELIRVLKPDLIIAGSKRAFPEEMKEQLRAEIFRYDPHTLEQILDKINKLGSLLEKEREASGMVRRLRERLAQVVIPGKRPTVIYEISERSLRVAGRRSIITSIIEAAGGVNLIETDRKHVTISPERVLDVQPDFYIYQIGPMNKNPVPPAERPYFRSLRSIVVKVDEYEFARPGINAFDAVVDLNRIFLQIQ